MPVMNGLEFLKYIRETHLSEAFFVILSGYGDFTYAKEAIKWQCTDYILKPIQKSQLLALLSKVKQMQQDKKEESERIRKIGKAYFVQQMQTLLLGRQEETALSYVKGQVDFGRGIRYIGIESEDGETDTDIGPEKKRQLQRQIYEACMQYLGGEYSCLTFLDAEGKEECYDVGFILSFGGTLGIVLLSKDFTRLFKRLGKLNETLSVTCSAQFILAPIMMYYFNTFSILSIVTNIIVVPISGSITILGFVVFIISKISFPIAKLIANSLYVLATFTIWVADMFSKIPFSLIRTITPNVFEIFLFYFVVFYFANLKVRGKKYRFIGEAQNNETKVTKMLANIRPIWVITFIVIFVFSEIIYYKIPRNYLDISCIDVGQGDSVLIETDSRKFILIDGGGNENYDVGENILLPYLLDRRVLNIDIIFSSHSDADHLNGIITALKNMHVNNVVIGKGALGYEKVYRIAESKNVKVIEVQKGDVLEIGNLVFEVLSPSMELDNNNVNDYSLVFKLIYGKKSMLFTGDISAVAERQVI